MPDATALHDAEDALAAVLPQPLLLQGFLGAADSEQQSQQSAKTTRLLAGILQAAGGGPEAASGGPGAAVAGSTALWAVAARRLARPYLARYVYNTRLTKCTSLI